MTGFGRRIRTTSLAILAASALALTGCSSDSANRDTGNGAPIDSGITARFDEAINRAMQYSGSDSAIIGVWSGDTEYVAAYGDGAKADAAIRGAQTTQPMLCALLLDLAADNRVSLDRKVSEDLPRQVGIENVSYGQLCNGTSGLADFKSRLADIFVNNPARPWSDRELFAQGLAASPLSWPGLDVHVSDTPALLLARALPVVTNTPLSDLLRTRVLDPIGIAATTSFPADTLSTAAPSTMLSGLSYPSSGGAPVCGADPVRIDKVSPSMLGGAGAMTTSVRDLRTFYTAYLDGRYGTDSKALITQTAPTTNPERDAAGTATTEVVANGSMQQWGFGVERVGPLYGMSGSITGTLTASYTDPESKFTVVVVLNNSSAGASFVHHLAMEIAAIASESGIGPAGLAWTAADRSAALAASAICQPAAG